MILTLSDASTRGTHGGLHALIFVTISTATIYQVSVLERETAYPSISNSILFLQHMERLTFHHLEVPPQLG